MKNTVQGIVRGAAQVVFVDNTLCGALIIAGIVVGAFAMGIPAMAACAPLGLVCANLGAIALNCREDDLSRGLWGFNGVLIGCAMPLFFSGIAMWLSVIVLSAVSAKLRELLNQFFGRFGMTSLTMPFIALTWFAFTFGMCPAVATSVRVNVALSLPEVIDAWLRGVSQIFLVSSPICGAFILAGILAVARRAAAWCAVGSAVGVALGLVWGMPVDAVVDGLAGFNPALTAIALGAVYHKNVATTLVGIVATYYVDLGVAAVIGQVLPVLTFPFCATTWMMLAISRSKS